MTTPVSRWLFLAALVPSVLVATRIGGLRGVALGAAMVAALELAVVAVYRLITNRHRR